MDILTNLPPFVIALLQSFEAAVLAWCSARVYARLVARQPRHLLVQVHARVNLSALEAACAGFHHTSGPGAPATHPIAPLVRALLVKALYHGSTRDVEEQINHHLLVKWFVGYRLDEPGPDHVTLSRFEAWVSTNARRTLFDDVLRQIDEALPGARQEAHRLQVGDTYALQANAAKESRIRLIRHACEALLRELNRVAPAAHARVQAGLNHDALFGTPNETDEYFLSEEQRAARLQTTVRAALACVQAVHSDLLDHPGHAPEALAALTARIDLVHKILSDEVEIRPAPSPAPPVPSAPAPPAGRSQVDEPAASPAEASSATPPAQSEPDVQVTARTAHEHGAYRIGSVTDPDASYRQHGGEAVLGYNINVLIGGGFIREITAAPGAQPDATPLAAMLRIQQQQHALTPAQVAYDSAAGLGKIRHDVAEATAGHTQVVAPLNHAGPRASEFGPEDFALAPDGRTLTCPHGQISYAAYRSATGDGRIFRFRGHQCVDCPLRARCRSPKQAPDSMRMRQVFISDYRPEVEAARAFNATPEYRAVMKQRPEVERTIAELVRYNGARHASRRGLANADYQAKTNATAVNVKRWMREEERRGHPVVVETIQRDGRQELVVRVAKIPAAA